MELPKPKLGEDDINLLDNGPHKLKESHYKYNKQTSNLTGEIPTSSSIKACVGGNNKPRKVTAVKYSSYRRKFRRNSTIFIN